MKIALDYDGTYTADPGMWDMLISWCDQSRHEFTIVTMRHPTEVIDIDIPVIYTSRKAKMKYCLDHGHVFDIWIDDKPHWLFKDG